MSYKIARGRVPTCRSKDSHKTASRPADPNQPPNQYKGDAKPRPARHKTPHAKPYSVCPPMNSLMIDVGGIAAISSGESATI